ncbi:MAG: hypothetical protein JXB15_08820 [Anaerolineales bacterium]|nr:hypothetical protein [Anaerolineales bacterium]
MDKPIELVPLVCLRCSTPVPAEIEEVAWACAQCGQGMMLDEDQGLLPLEINCAAGIAPNVPGKPFWVADGRVALKRETYDRQTGESEQFWSQPRRFLIPAFNSTLENLINLGTSLLLQPPSLQPGPAARFEPVTLSPNNILPIAEFIVIAIEANRKDKLKKVDFSLQLSPPVLWILP